MQEENQVQVKVLLGFMQGEGVRDSDGEEEACKEKETSSRLDAENEASRHLPFDA